jgi:hypothetical protein
MKEESHNFQKKKDDVGLSQIILQPWSKRVLRTGCTGCLRSML